MHLVSQPQVVFHGASADSCSTNDSGRTQISGVLCLTPSSLVLCIANSINLDLPALLLVYPQAMDSIWFMSLLHLDMQPPLGNTLGKQRIHPVYLSLTYPSLIA